jgi:hypothetical protein
MRFKKEFSIRLIKYEAWWQAIGVQELPKTIIQRVVHFKYPKMNLVSHISESIQRMGSGDNFTTDISERLHIGNVQEAYRSHNIANYIREMLKLNDRSTGPDNMEGTISYLALQDWYDIDSAKVFNLLSAADKQRNSHNAHLSRFQHCHDEQFFCPVTPQVHNLRETHVSVLCRSHNLTTLREALEDFEIPNFGQLFRAEIEEDRGQEVSGLVLGYNQNVLLDSRLITVQNGLPFYRQLFYCPTSVECLGLECKVEYTHANQEIVPEPHDIYVQYTDSDLDYTFQGQISSFPILYFSQTPLNRILQYQESLPSGKAISTFSTWCKMTQRWILRPQDQEYAVVIPTM